MKSFGGSSVLWGLSSLFLAMPAHAQEAPISGVYVGGKVGASIQSLSKRTILQDAYSLYEEGVGAYSADAQSWGFPEVTDTQIGGGAQLGYNFARTGYPIRLELDYTARGDADASSSRNMTWWWKLNGVTYSNIPGVMAQTDKVGLQTVLTNIWYDIPTGTAFTPYLGGGVGWAFLNYKNTRAMTTGGETEGFTDEKDATNFAWSIGAGVSYALSSHFTLDVGYRYVDAGDVKVSAAGGEPLHAEASVASHDVMVGLRYSFGGAPAVPLK